eukprot:5764705-Pyramimonas_sp.AAC.1
MTRRATAHGTCLTTATNYAAQGFSPSTGPRTMSPTGVRLPQRLDRNKYDGQLALLPQTPTCSSFSEDPPR